MRLRAIFFALIVLAGAAVGAGRLGGAAAGWYEAQTRTELASALGSGGQRWASADVDGLNVVLSGAAPDETSRFRALEIARRVVNSNRIDDATTLKASRPLPPAPFALELLRNDADISLIGLVPETGGRDVIRAALRAGALNENVTDMLESASEPAPDGWREALGFGLSVLAELPRAKVSVAPGQVKVIAVSDSDTDRATLEERLKKAVPDGVSLSLEISSPRPVIAPFAFDVQLAGGTLAVSACSAETPEMASAILTALRAAGLHGDADCAIGLGSPSPDWSEAIATGLDALSALGGGRFTLRDLAARLTAPEETAPEKLAEVSARLNDNLPDVFQLETVMPPRMETGEDGERIYAPAFSATLGGNGKVRLAGALKDETSRDAVVTYATALFGHDQVTDATVLDPALPEGWPGRVLAGVEALASLAEGKLAVTREKVAVEGWGLDEHVDDKVEALLDAKVGPTDAVVDVSFNAEAAAAAANAARPRPEICADQINAILAAGSIQFDAGSADIAPESRGVIAAIADVLRGCPGADFEIGGHTDSHGSADSNQALSDARAQAVLAALRSEDLPLVGLTARGFGASDPVADNDSVAGRARNRRIEFTLVAPEGAKTFDPEVQSGDASAETDATPSADTGTACADEIRAALASGSIQFAAGSTTIAPESEEVVRTIRETLETCPGARFEIGGYTDSRGSDSGNLRLSQERAEAVLAALGNENLPTDALVAKGYGEADPIADNATAEGRAQNRRIEFKLLEPAPEPASNFEGDKAPESVDTDATCSRRIAGMVSSDSIQFAAGSATIAPESQATVAAIADALRDCPEIAMEIGGHTDSEGSESGNLRLSQERAEAVLAALRSEGLPLPGLTAKGYGESEPVADNATAEGRAQNRRIAFTFEGGHDEDAGDEAAATDGGGAEDGSQ